MRICKHGCMCAVCLCEQTNSPDTFEVKILIQSRRSEARLSNVFQARIISTGYFQVNSARAESDLTRLFSH